MKALRFFLLLSTPFLLLLLLAHDTQVLAVEIIYADADSSASFAGAASAAAAEREAMTQVIARNRAVAKQIPNDEEALMVVICAGLQDKSTECAEIKTFQQFFNDLPPFPPGDSQPARRRRKRNAWFGSNDPFNNNFDWSNSWNSGWNSNSGSWSNSFFPTPDPWPSNSFNSYRSNAIICPSFVDQSKEYRLNPDSTNYPAAAIGTELNRNPILRDCLIREIVLPNDPPTIEVEDFRLTANVTCQFSDLRLWRYQSQAANAECWIMQNFQENIIYKNCTTRFCSNCKDKQTSSLSFSDNLNQKFCITDYRIVSVWAYCPTLPIGNQIIRDRIIIPDSCTCQSIRCEPIPTWRRK